MNFSEFRKGKFLRIYFISTNKIMNNHKLLSEKYNFVNNIVLTSFVGLVKNGFKIFLGFKYLKSKSLINY